MYQSGVMELHAPLKTSKNINIKDSTFMEATKSFTEHWKISTLSVLNSLKLLSIGNKYFLKVISILEIDQSIHLLALTVIFTWLVVFLSTTLLRMISIVLTLKLDPGHYLNLKEWDYHHSSLSEQLQLSKVKKIK